MSNKCSRVGIGDEQASDVETTTPRRVQQGCDDGGGASQRGNRSVSNTHALSRFHRTLLASVLIYSFCEIV